MPAPVVALLWILVIFVAGYVAFYFADRLPPEMAWVAKIVIAVVGVVALVFLIMPLFGWR